jgi:hypothetical protein
MMINGSLGSRIGQRIDSRNVFEWNSPKREFDRTRRGENVSVLTSTACTSNTDPCDVFQSWMLRLNFSAACSSEIVWCEGRFAELQLRLFSIHPEHVRDALCRYNLNIESFWASIACNVSFCWLRAFVRSKSDLCCPACTRRRFDRSRFQANGNRPQHS